MKPPSSDPETLRALMGARGVKFSALVEMSGLDKRSDFVGANLRGVDFQDSDLAGFNFSKADLTGADMSRATGKDQVVLVDARIVGLSGGPDPGELRDRPELPAMVRVPAGTFTMGVSAREEAREKVPKEYRGWSTPRQTITIPRAFWLGKYPVSREEFAAFVADTDHPMPSTAWTFEPDDEGKWNYISRENRDWRNPGFPQTDRDPVVCVNFEDAMAYVEWLTRVTGHPYRLPSEAEWEYAARAGTTTSRFWGDGRDGACRFANVSDHSLMSRMGAEFDSEQFFKDDDGYAFTAPVGSFLPNPFGLYDMLGNVWEWTMDCWNETLTGIPADGSARTTGDCGRRVVRGGSWNDGPGFVRAGYRGRGGTGDRVTITGFRVARTHFPP